MKNLTDDSLMQKIADGNQRAFRTLFDRHGSRILGYATRLLGDREKAEDMAQEVWVKIVRLAPSYKSQGHFIAWASTITRNACFNELRSQKKFANSVALDDENSAIEIADRQSLEDDITNMAELRLVQQEIDALPELQRVALVTWLTEEVSYDDLAHDLGVTVSALKSILFRARRQLQSRLKETA